MILDRREFFKSIGVIAGVAAFGDIERKLNWFLASNVQQHWVAEIDEEKIGSAIKVADVQTRVIDGRAIAEISVSCEGLWDAVTLRCEETDHEWKTKNGDHWYPVGDDVEWMGFPPEEMIVWAH